MFARSYYRFYLFQHIPEITYPLKTTCRQYPVPLKLCVKVVFISSGADRTAGSGRGGPGRDQLSETGRPARPARSVT